MLLACFIKLLGDADIHSLLRFGTSRVFRVFQLTVLAYKKLFFSAILHLRLETTPDLFDASVNIFMPLGFSVQFLLRFTFSPICVLADLFDSIEFCIVKERYIETSDKFTLRKPHFLQRKEPISFTI